MGLHLLNHIQGESIVQVGFILAKPAWGRGFATEMALALLRYGFTDLALPRIVGIAAQSNLASQHVLSKIGLERHGERAFSHPAYASQGPMAWFERTPLTGCRSGQQDSDATSDRAHRALLEPGAIQSRTPMRKMARLAPLLFFVTLAATIAGCGSGEPLRVTTIQLGRSLNADTPSLRSRRDSDPTTPSIASVVTAGAGSATIGVRWMFYGHVVDEPKRKVSYQDIARDRIPSQDRRGAAARRLQRRSLSRREVGRDAPFQGGKGGLTGHPEIQSRCSCCGNVEGARQSSCVLRPPPSWKSTPVQDRPENRD